MSLALFAKASSQHAVQGQVMDNQDDEKPKIVVDNVINLDSKRQEETPHAQIAEALEMAKKDLDRRPYKGIFITMIQDNDAENLWDYVAGIDKADEVLYRQIATDGKLLEWQSRDDED